MQVLRLCFMVVQVVAPIFINLVLNYPEKVTLTYSPPKDTIGVTSFGVMPGTGIAMASTIAGHAIFILM